jgi:hypothetical protein
MRREETKLEDTPGKPYPDCIDDCDYNECGRCVWPEMKPYRPRVVAVDLDGVILEHEGWQGHNSFGRVKDGAIEALSEFRKHGYVIVIWTTRKNVDEIRRYLEENGVPFDYINEHPFGPPGTSRKIWADVYLDDRAVRFENWEQAKIDVIKKLEGA